MRIALVAYGVAFGGTIAASLVAAAGLPILFPGSAGEPLTSLLAGGFASSVTLLLVALAGAPRPRPRRLGLVAARVSARTMLLLVIGMLALGQALESFSVVLGLDRGGALEMIRRAFTDPPAGMVAVSVLSLGGLAGFAEELFFRGFMQTRLRECWRPRWAIGVTAAGFGLLHLDPVHAVLAFGLGCYLGFVAERCRSVVPSVVCHVANNAASILLMATVGAVPGVGPNLAIATAALAVFAGVVIGVSRRLPAPDRSVGGIGPLRVG